MSGSNEPVGKAPKAAFPFSAIVGNQAQIKSPTMSLENFVKYLYSSA